MENERPLVPMKAFLLATVALLGAVAFVFGCGEKSVANAPKPRVEVARVAPFAVKVRESGTLEALVSVEVKSNVEGEVIELNVEEGDHVEEGEVLLRIDDEQIREEVQQAKANYDAAKAQLDRAVEDTQVTKQRLDSQLKQAFESVRSAQASLEAAKQTTIQQIGQAETNISTSKDTLARDEITLSQAKIALQQLEIRLNQLKADLESARVAHENAQANLKRTEELYAKQFVSKKALEDARQAASSAQTAFENAQQNVENQKKAIESQKATISAQDRVIQSRKTTLEFQIANLETLKASRQATERQANSNLELAQSRLEEIQQTIEAQKRMAELAETSARAAVVRAESSLKTAQQRLGWTTVVAPMSGTVVDLQIEQGEIITSGRSSFASGPPLMTIADLSQMIVRVPINEVDMGEIAVGQRVEIAPSAYPNKKFEGRVRQIAPSGNVQDGVVRFEIEIEVLGSPKVLMPGMTADVDIFTDEREKVLQLPLEAVKEQKGFAVLLRLKPDEAAKLSVGDAVKLQTRLGKEVNARVSAVGNPVRLALLGEARGWRPGPVEFTLVLPSGQTLPSLSGRVTEATSHVVEVIEGEVPSNGEPKTRKVPVEVGAENEAFYEIVSGIRPGTKVLVRPERPEAGMMGRRR